MNKTTENIIEGFRNRLMAKMSEDKRRHPRAFLVYGMVDDCISEFRCFIGGKGSIREMEAFESNWRDYLGPAALLLWRESARRVAMGDTLHGKPCEWPYDLRLSFAHNAPNWMRSGCHLTKDGDKYAVWGVFRHDKYGIRNTSETVARIIPQGWVSFKDDENMVIYIKKAA